MMRSRTIPFGRNGPKIEGGTRRYFQKSRFYVQWVSWAKSTFHDLALSNEFSIGAGLLLIILMSWLVIVAVVVAL